MKSVVQLFLFLMLASILTSVFPVWAETPEVNVIALKHRLAEEVLPVLRPLLAPGESITGMDNRLIVRAAPASLVQIEKALSEIDSAHRNLRIRVRQTDTGENTQDSQGISGHVQSGNSRIVLSNANRERGGLTVSGAGRDSTLQVRTERRSISTRTSSTQNLIVSDGGHAFLRVGESVPDVQQFLVFIGNRPRVLSGVQYRDVTTGFDVEPRIIGEHVRLIVSPRLAFRGDHGVQTVNFAELGTQLTVRPGEWVDLGAIVGTAHELNRRILNSRTHGTRETSGFQMRVDLQ